MLPSRAGSVMYEPANRHAPNAAFLLPALFAASASEMAGHLAKQFTSLAIGLEAETPPPPQWATPHRVALKLRTVRLRDFATSSEGPPCLLCTPFALHGSALSDLAAGHSLVAALRDAGVTNLFATDWHSASSDMRFLGIDNYLADLNVAVDEIGPPVDLIGLCQGGWLALVYAARFPTKVRRLVLVGAPVDIAAAKSSLSNFAADVPLTSFHELVRLGEGIVHGQQMLGLWGMSHGPNEADATLQAGEAVEPSEREALAERFQQWHAETVDLPGSFFLQVVEWLFKENRIAEGRFVALGQKIDLSRLTAPIYLLAGSRDEVVAVDQLLAAERLVGTRSEHVVKMTQDCGHLSLFLGAEVLGRAWPDIAGFLLSDLNEPQANPEREDAPAVGGRSIRTSTG